MPKEDRIAARINPPMAEALARLTSAWNATESEILRNALHEYLIAHDSTYAATHKSRERTNQP